MNNFKINNASLIFEKKNNNNNNDNKLNKVKEVKFSTPHFTTRVSFKNKTDLHVSYFYPRSL